MNIIEEAEKNFAEFIGTEYAIMVSSGTSAIHTALLACDVGAGDEVIVPAFTYTSVANMVLACGATPIFVDINPITFLMDTTKVYKARNEKTKAIIFCNLFGKEIGEKGIKDIDLGIPVIMDNAQCVKQGSWQYDIQCFSFYRSKQFSCFEGGAICTNDDELNKQMRIIMNQGEDGKYNTVRLGFNYRMSDLQATMINHQFMYHHIGGNAELGRFGPKDGHYPLTVYEQQLYKKLGYYKKYKGICPVAEKLAKKVREGTI